MKNFLSRQCFGGLLSWLICISHLSAQTPERYSVSGVVLDAETNHPLPNANVFFANTMMGSATDSTGRFLIRNVPGGTFELVVSRVGYEVAKREIQIPGELAVTPAFRLRPVILAGAEVEVTAPYPKKWKTHLERFTDLLFSTTKNAAKAEILNSHVLEFHEEKDDQFVVTAPEPLVIENRALGYKLNLVLVEFSASSQKLQYKGSIKFDELIPPSDKQAAEWRKNRLRTYQGSLRHFLATISDTRKELSELSPIDARIRCARILDHVGARPRENRPARPPRQ